MRITKRAEQTFIRERLRYEHDQRRFAERKEWTWDRYRTRYHLNHVQDLLANDSTLAEQYLAVYEVGRDWGADSKWVGNQIRLLLNRERHQERVDKGWYPDADTVEGVTSDGPADESREGPNGDIPSDYDKAAYQQWDAARNRGGGTRDWVEFERIVLGFIHDAGGANVRPGEQMPKEIVRDAHDKALAHLDYLEPLAKHFPFDALTHADLLICGYPIRLLANVRGTPTGRMDRATKRLVNSLQQCEGCGLPFIGVNKKGNPTIRPKTCDRECWNRKRRALRAKERQS